MSSYSKYYSVNSWMWNTHEDIDIYHANIQAIVYSYTRNSNKCWLTNKQFANTLKCSNSVIKKKIKQLIKWNILASNTNRKSINNTTRQLVFLIVEARSPRSLAKVKKTKARSPGDGGRSPGDGARSPHDQDRSPRSLNSNNNNNNNNTTNNKEVKGSSIQETQYYLVIFENETTEIECTGKFINDTHRKIVSFRNRPSEF